MLAYKVTLSEDYIDSLLLDKKTCEKYLEKKLTEEQVASILSKEETKDKAVLKDRKALRKAVLNDIGFTVARTLAEEFVPEARKEEDGCLCESEEYFKDRNFRDYNDDVYYSPTISKSSITFIVQTLGDGFDAISLEDVIGNTVCECSPSKSDAFTGEFLDY